MYPRNPNVRKTILILLNLVTTCGSGNLLEKKKGNHLRNIQDSDERYQLLYSIISDWYSSLLSDIDTITVLVTKNDKSYSTLVRSFTRKSLSSILIVETELISQYKYNLNCTLIKDSDIIVIILETEENLKNIIPKGNAFYWNNRAHFLVIIMSSKGHLKVNSHRIFQELWNTRVLNVVVMHIENRGNELPNACKVYISNMCIAVLAYNPFLNMKYRSNSTSIGDVQRVFKEAYSTTTTANLHSYTLKTTSAYGKYSPSFSFWKDDNGIEKSEGVYVRVFESFTKYMNFTTTNIRIHGQTKVGSKATKGTGIGVIEDLASSEAELAFIILGVLPERLKVIEYTDYISLSSPSILVPKGDRKPTWLSLIELYSTEVWCSMIIVFLIVSLARGAMGLKKRGGRKEDVSLMFLDLFGIIFLQSKLRSRINSERILLFAWTYLCLIVTSLFQGGIVSVLTIPRYYPDMNTLQEVAESNLILKGTAFYQGVLSHVSDPVSLALHNKFQLSYNYEELLKSIASGDEVAVIGSDNVLMYYGYKVHNDLATEITFHIVKEHLGIKHGAFGVAKGSPYVARLNILIRRMHQSGLISKWYADMIQESDSNLASESISNSNIVVITLDHLQAGFYVNALGTLISLCVFSLEVVYFKVMKIYLDIKTHR